MRVLQINSVCGVGSTGRIATDIHAIIKKNGHDSYIAYGRNNSMNCDTTIRIGNNLDNYLHVLQTRIFDKHGFGSKKATKEFISKVKELEPDVIHLHNIHGYYLNLEMLFEYLKIADKPVVWTLHDCWAFTGHCAHFDYIECNKWITGCLECPQKKSYPSSLVDNSINNYSKKKISFNGIKNLTIVTPSEWLAGLVKQSFLGEYPVKVIKNGINLEVFKPTNSNFRKKYDIENKFIILGVANNWIVKKGIEYFMALAKKLDRDEIIVLVGLSEEMKESLPKNIIGITRTNNIEELAEIYSASDVFVNPTLEEVMGLTNIEALACGTPVITFNTGGCTECIDNMTGIVVEKGNLAELRREIYNIKYKKKVFNKNDITKRAKSFYDKNELYLEYLNLYESKRANNSLSK